MARDPITVSQKIATILEKLGKENGTKLPDASPPAALTTNSEIEKWHNERQSIYDILVAQQIESFGKKQVKKAKEKFALLFDVKAGAIIRGNVSMGIEVRSSGERLDKASLVTELVKLGLSLEQIEKAYAAASSAGTATYYKPNLIIDKE